MGMIDNLRRTVASLAGSTSAKRFPDFEDIYPELAELNNAVNAEMEKYDFADDFTRSVMKWKLENKDN